MQLIKFTIRKTTLIMVILTLATIVLTLNIKKFEDMRTETKTKTATESTTEKGKTSTKASTGTKSKTKNKSKSKSKAKSKSKQAVNNQITSSAPYDLLNTVQLLKDIGPFVFKLNDKLPLVYATCLEFFKEKPDDYASVLTGFWTSIGNFAIGSGKWDNSIIQNVINALTGKQVLIDSQIVVCNESLKVLPTCDTTNILGTLKQEVYFGGFNKNQKTKEPFLTGMVSSHRELLPADFFTKLNEVSRNALDVPPFNSSIVNDKPNNVNNTTPDQPPRPVIIVPPANSTNSTTQTNSTSGSINSPDSAQPAKVDPPKPDQQPAQQPDNQQTDKQPAKQPDQQPSSDKIQIPGTSLLEKINTPVVTTNPINTTSKTVVQGPTTANTLSSSASPILNLKN
jgi:hypothetical protein